MKKAIEKTIETPWKTTKQKNKNTKQIQTKTRNKHKTQCKHHRKTIEKQYLSGFCLLFNSFVEIFAALKKYLPGLIGHSTGNYYD